MTYNLTLETDAYHQTMGYMVEDPMAMESYVFYARRGGPQVVVDLSQTLQRLLAAIPDLSQVEQAEAFWWSQGIPFAASVWRDFCASEHLPISVRGVRDGEVVRPGDPVAIITAPAIIAGVIETILIGEQMASMQLATRFIKVASALDWDTSRVFEVGYRAVDGSDEHLRKLAVLKRIGLKATSNGLAACQLGMSAVGTMGHRFTQRFTGEQADYDAFNAALDKMLAYRKQNGIRHPVPLSFLLDTRASLTHGLPAALLVIKQRIKEIEGRVNISLRLDSGDLRHQFRVLAKSLLKLQKQTQYLPGIIVESGLTAEDVKEFENMAKSLGFPREKVFYGLGGFLVAGIDRDAIAAVYKISRFSLGQEQFDTMKFSDELASGKESYPGDIELWEGRINVNGKLKLVREIALRTESQQQLRKGFRPLFVELAINGKWCDSANVGSDEDLQARAKQRWTEVTQNYICSDPAFYAGDDDRHRPYFSAGLQSLVKQLREQQLSVGQQRRVSCV